MALRNIVIPKAEVSLANGQSFTVSGISANQVFGLYHRHRDDLGKLFDRFSGRTKVEASDVLNSFEGIVSQFPLLVAETIAIAAGGDPFDTRPADPEDPDSITNWQADVSAALSLPLPAQVDALFKISEQTFTVDMPPKKFFALLVGMIQQVNASLMTSDNGSED